MLKLFAFAQAYAASTAGRREEGQTMAEYGVVLAVITFVAITALSTLSETVQSGIESVAGLVPG